nr:PREDICTED: protein D1-like [Bemisia tabaci]
MSPWSLLGMCLKVLLVEQSLAIVKYRKGAKFKYRRKGSTSDIESTPTTENMVEIQKKWDAVRILPRSEDIVDSYLKQHKIVPHIIPKSPKYAIEVVYFNSIVVDFGNELWPYQVDVMPYRTVWPTELGAYYTILLISPDIPIRAFPYEAEYLYWMVANVFDYCATSTGVTYADYLTPRIVGEVGSNDTDKHRFIFLVYKQPMGIVSYQLPYMPSNGFYEYRKHFNTTELAEKYGLGLPVAANFFQMTRVEPNQYQFERGKQISHYAAWNPRLSDEHEH